MKKSDFLSAVKKGHADFLKSFEGLSHDALVEPGAVGKWSVKDVISHVSMWKAEAIRLLYFAQQDEVPPRPYRSKDIDHINEEWYQAASSRTVEQVMADYHGVSKQLLKRLEALPEKHWDRPESYPWLQGETIQKIVADNSFDHEDEHAAEIKDWRERCK